MHWIINHQLGRRNLEALQRDMLIGRRHELEKGIQGGDHKSNRQNAGLTTAERLGEEYQVDPRTVERDGAFVQGLDALKEVREDLPTSILTKKTKQETKRQSTGTGRRHELEKRAIGAPEGNQASR
jgi:hypothetical protein